MVVSTENEKMACPQCRSHYRTVSTELVTIRNAPVGIEGLAEEITAIDASIVTNRCVLPWVFVFSHSLDSCKLKTALAASLKAHPVLSGRIHPVDPRERRPDGFLRKFQLVHSNDGVTFVSAATNLTMKNFSDSSMSRKCYRRGSPMPGYCEDMNRFRLLRGRDSLLRVKLTQLAGGGSVLAVTFAHVVADGKSFVRFMDHWAANYRSDYDSIMQPFQNRMVLEPAVIEASISALIREEKPKAIGAIPPYQATKPANGLYPLTHKRCASDPTPVRFSVNEIEIDEDTQSEGDFHSLKASPWLDVPEANTWGAISSMWRLSSQISRDRKRFPKLVRELTAITLRLPELQLRRLKSLATASCRTSEYVSTNDCVSALFWITMCDLRGKPLPGLSSLEANKGRFSLAVDLRENGLKHCVPENFFGNASWSIQIEGGKCSPATELECKDMEEEMQCTDAFEEAFCWAARKVRSSLKNFRGHQDSPVEMLKSVRKLQESCLSSKVMVISETLLNFDAFMTSWQFPIWDIDFGSGGPCNFQGIMHPTPPFHGILHPSHPSDKSLSLVMTIPTSAVQALQNSKVLSHLAPKARFIS